MENFPWNPDIPSIVATAPDGPMSGQRGRLGPLLPRKEAMARTNPTLRQRRLGAELRRMREQAGLGGSQLGREVGMNPAQVTQMESGKIGISVERLHTIATTCMCANQPLIDALADVITERGRAGWWEEYREALATDFLDIAELEGHARRLSVYGTTFVPGLLQTGSYTAALFAQAYPPPLRHEVDLKTAFRMQRQRIIRSGAKPYSAFIHEAALRMQFSDPRVNVEQIDALIADSEQPSISVRVVPFAAGAVPSACENFTYAEGPITELDAAQMDTGHGGRLFDSPAHLARFRALLASMDSTALSEEESRDFMRSIKEEMAGKHV
ncbi:helix-turn-helix domain-containing protein [Kitasatospora sp. NPDC059803]|uniref:helix-turn-helix domain-containing protein n=2 Tax=unclassified Kitasatospora TaxID=2633591 RepID=UPI0036463DC5